MTKGFVRQLRRHSPVERILGPRAEDKTLCIDVEIGKVGDRGQKQMLTNLKDQKEEEAYKGAGDEKLILCSN